MKWQIRRVKYPNGYWWEATRPDGMWISRRSWASLVVVVAKAEQHRAQVTIQQLSGGS